MSTIPIPSTPAGRRLTSWLTAINSPSNTESALREFYEQSCFLTSESASNNIANELALRSRTGGFDPVEVITSEPTKISVLMQQRIDGDKWGTMTIEVEDQEPWYIFRFLIQRQGLGEKVEEVGKGEEGSAAKQPGSFG